MILILGCALIPCHNRITRPWTLQRVRKSNRVQSPTLILIRKRDEVLVLEKTYAGTSRLGSGQFCAK